MILVGTKIDLRGDEKAIKKLKSKDMKSITYEEGKALSVKIGAFDYMENSALTQTGLQETFDCVLYAMAAKIASIKEKKKPPSKQCFLQ